MLLLVQVDSAALAEILAPLTHSTARATQLLLGAIGIESGRAANVLFHEDGFAYEIHYRCVGLVPIAALVIMRLLNQPRMVGMMRRLAFGALGLVFLNLVRLTHLFYLGVIRPDAFDFAHVVVWRFILVAAVILLTVVGSKRNKRATSADLEPLRAAVPAPT